MDMEGPDREKRSEIKDTPLLSQAQEQLLTETLIQGFWEGVVKKKVIRGRSGFEGGGDRSRVE